MENDMDNTFVLCRRNFGLFVIVSLLFNSFVIGEELAPGKIEEIKFPKADLPATLFTMITGTESPPCMDVRLPDDFDAAKSYVPDHERYGP
jgi:hypothetical protein